MNKWNRENNYDVFLKIITFILSPVLGMLYSLRNIRTKSSYVVFFLFSIVFGFSYTVSSGKSDDFKGDGASYRLSFEIFRDYSYEQYLAGLLKYLQFDSNIKDYYFETIVFFVSRLSDNYHFMFMVFAIVFSFFALKSFKFLINEANFNTTLSCYILAYIFMINQIFNINGVRFWTAAWVAVYCIFQIFVNNSRRYLILALLIPFIHGSYLVFILLLIIGIFFSKSYKFWVPIFFASFFVSNFSVELVRGVIDQLPSFIAGMAKSYTDEEYINEVSEQGTGFYWVAEIFKILIKFYINFLVYLFVKNGSLISNNIKTNKIFPFLLMWMSFVNFTMAIPSLGNRYVLLAYPMIAYIWLVNFKGKKYTKFLYLMPVVFLFSFYTRFLNYLSILEPSFYISSPIYLLYKYLINYN